MNEASMERSARGLVYHQSVAGITLVLGLVRSILLMRLLIPEDFGIIGLALFFSTLVTPLQSFGLDNALIQSKTNTEQIFSTHRVLRLSFGLIFFLVCLAFSPVLNHYYGKSVVSAFIALAGVQFIDATYSTHNVILRREMRFGALALLNLFSSLFMTIIAPLLAYLGFGFWSLVAEQIVGSLVRWIGILFVLRSHKVVLALDVKEAEAQLKFGSRVVMSRFFGLLLDRFDDFLIGTKLGTIPLGYYSRAYEMAQYPERVLATPVNYVFYSTYAVNQENPRQLTDAFTLSGNYLIRMGFFLASLLLINAFELTELMFGRQWLPIVPVFQLMLIYIIMNPLYENWSYFILGTGKPEILNRIRLIQAGIFLPAVIVFAELWDILGVAMATNMMMLIGTTLAVIFIRRTIKFSFARMILLPIIAAVAASLIGFSAGNCVLTNSLWSRTAIKGGIITFIYWGMLWLIEPNTLRGTIQFIIETIKNQRLKH